MGTSRWSHAVQALPPTRRALMLAGCGLAVCLTLVLALKPLLAHWQALQQWRALAVQVNGLAPAVVWTGERLQQLAGDQSVVLEQVEQGANGWQLRGSVADADTLQQWLATLHRQGGEVTQWQVERQATGLHFDLQLAGEARR